jgi:hypothetical protein
MKTHNINSEKIISLLKDHNDILRKYEVKKIGLFGSFARGDQNRNSDIDFLVEFEKPVFENFMDLAFYLEELFGRKVELITNGNLSSYIQPYVEKEVKWVMI